MASDTILMILEELVAHIRSQNMVGRFDVNTLSEDFFCEVLNTTYGFNLTNLNKTGKMNYAGIDLGDSGSGFTYQITSENTKQKIKENLATYEAAERYKTYPHLRFLILDREVKPAPKTLEELERDNENFVFKPSQHVTCVKELLRDIEQIKEDDIVFDLLKYLQKEVPLWKLLTDNGVDSEITKVVDDIVKSAQFSDSKRNFDHLDTVEKIKLNFHSEEDRQFITDEYNRALPRFPSIEQIIKAYGPNDERILQSSMADMYNKFKQDKTKNNRQIFNTMCERIEQSAPSADKQATRRFAIKSLILFHFEDCTIFEKTPKEKALRQ